MTAPLDAFLDQARLRPRYAGRMRKIVVRMGEAEIGKLDKLGAELRRASGRRTRLSRAAVVRALTLAGLANIPGLDATNAPLPDRCAP